MSTLLADLCHTFCEQPFTSQADLLAKLGEVFFRSGQRLPEVICFPGPAPSHSCLTQCLEPLLVAVDFFI